MIDRYKYRRLLWDRNATRAITTMACIEVKRDRNYNPHCAKIRIVILGNNKDRDFNKSHHFAPFLYYSYLRVLTYKSTKKRRILQQGDCKNAF